MPARRAMHDLAQRTLDPRRSLRATAHPRSRAADRPGVEGRLHSHPPESRTQDRSPDATPPRRPPRSRPRAHQSRCRLHAVGRRSEPRQARDARCHPPHRRLGREHHVTPQGRGHTAPQRPSGPAKTRRRPTQPGRTPPNDQHPGNGRHREPPTGHPTAHLNPRRTPIYTSLLDGRYAWPRCPQPLPRELQPHSQHQRRDREPRAGLPPGTPHPTGPNNRSTSPSPLGQPLGGMTPFPHVWWSVSVPHRGRWSGSAVGVGGVGAGGHAERLE